MSILQNASANEPLKKFTNELSSQIVERLKLQKLHPKFEDPEDIRDALHHDIPEILPQQNLIQPESELVLSDQQKEQALMDSVQDADIDHIQRIQLQRQRTQHAVETPMIRKRMREPKLERVLRNGRPILHQFNNIQPRKRTKNNAPYNHDVEGRPLERVLHKEAEIVERNVVKGAKYVGNALKHYAVTQYQNAREEFQNDHTFFEGMTSGVKWTGDLILDTLRDVPLIGAPVVWGVHRLWDGAFNRLNRFEYRHDNYDRKAGTFGTGT